MTMTGKKELKQEYKLSRPEMGLFKIESLASGDCYLYATQDMKSLMNRFRFQLRMGSHPDKALQREWDQSGADNFVMEVLERLDYDKDGSKTDYGEELELLSLIWREKLGQAVRGMPE